MAKLEAAIGPPPDAVRRLGALGVRIAEDAERLWQRLRLANAEHDRLASMAKDWWRVSPAQRAGCAGAALSAGTGALPRPRAARLGALAGRRGGPRLGRTRALPERWTAPVFPLKAADFIKRGVKQGPALGVALRAAEAAWIAADFPADAAAIVACGGQRSQVHRLTKSPGAELRGFVSPKRLYQRCRVDSERSASCAGDPASCFRTWPSECRDRR